MSEMINSLSVPIAHLDKFDALSSVNLGIEIITEGTGVAKRAGDAVIQISPVYAVLIMVALAMVGVFIGVWAGWFLTGKELRRVKTEIENLRISRDNAQHARTQAINERERAIRELQGKQHELTLTESQSGTSQRQLDQMQAYTRTLEQQVSDLTGIVRAQRTQHDEMRAQMFTSERVASERQIQLMDVATQLSDAQKLAADRQNALFTFNKLLEDYRGRVAEGHMAIAEMQRLVSALDGHIEAHRHRMSDIEKGPAIMPATPQNSPATAAALQTIPNQKRGLFYTNGNGAVAH